MKALLSKLWSFIGSKSGVLIAAVVAGLGAVAAVFSAGRRQGQMKQKLAQEEAEDTAEAAVAMAEREEALRAATRRERLNAAIRQAHEAANAAARHPPKTLGKAKDEIRITRVRVGKLK